MQKVAIAGFESILTITRLISVFEHYDTQQEAVKALA